MKPPPPPRPSSSSSSSYLPSLFENNAHNKSKKERCISMGSKASFLFSSLALTIIFSFLFLFHSNPLKIMPETVHDDQSLVQQKERIVESRCDLSKGHWIPDSKGSQYTNWSCSTIPTSKNCLRHGREDTDFLNWRWKPHQCDLPRFEGKQFLTVLRHKKLAFIGDSVARNHMDSLLCLLSREETPTDVYKDSEDRNRIWYFADHNFTLSILWSKFLMVGEERMINGSSSSGIYDLHLDKVDKWATELPSVDYAIISTAHWFFRPIHIHEDDREIGCVYCSEPNITTTMDPIDAIGLAFRAAFKYINECTKCNDKMVTVVRTFSPAHFENGTWNSGGSCRRTSPYGEKDVDYSEDYRWKLREIQIKEVERAREKDDDDNGGGNKIFRVLDVTMAMLLRPDGHPGAFWGNKWMKGYNDCVHWCLPGPIDVWSDFLMQILLTNEVAA